MIRDELNNGYFEWIYQLVCDDLYSKRLSYRKLLTRLHDTDFNYTIGMDENRAEDGTNLRYRFGYENSYEDSTITTYLNSNTCSVLEMMVALAIRCEEQIMDDPDIGDRMSHWFWNMIANLGLDSMSDANFDREYVDDAIMRFLNREYGQNGEGGLFTVKHCEYDLRNVEIWYQMCWYLDAILQ